jgi:quercetin dioxygenase-like cupin family protein
MFESNKGIWRLVGVGAAVVAVGLFGLLLVPAQQEAGAAQQSNFMGGAPEGAGDLASIDVRTSRLRFPAGVRSNWHTHEGGGQLLMIESGRALTQVRGEPIYEMHPNEPWYTAEGIEHWHGAHPDEEAMQWTIYGGTVNWLEPVTDEQYHGRAMRR